MAVYFTSDTHFGHAGALSRFRRPFPSVAAMDEAMEAAWNATVGADDEVWFLGDFALRLKPDAVGALLERLNGTKHLVAGNNDGPPTLKLPGWASVQHYAEIIVDDTLLVLCHYPFRTWNGMYHESRSSAGSRGARRDCNPLISKALAVLSGLAECRRVAYCSAYWPRT